MSDNPEHPNSEIDLDQVDEKQQEQLFNAYRDRLKVLKKAQEYSAQEDIPKAVEHYSQYLNVLAKWKRKSEEQLVVEDFDIEQDLAEMLLISHVYWDLAKAYDRSPTLQLESIRCLNQFCKFTIGFKYQYANAQMVKKFIKKRMAHNKRAFQQTYEKVKVEAKGCYISSYSLGFDHPVTKELRDFKLNILTKSSVGLWIINRYYKISPVLISHLIDKKPVIFIFDKVLFKPVLYLTYFTSKLFK